MLKFTLLLNINTFHKDQIAIFQKAMDVLVKFQALSGTAKSSLQHFYKDIPTLTKAYNASVQELCDVEERLNDVEASNTKLEMAIAQGLNEF